MFSFIFRVYSLQRHFEETGQSLKTARAGGNFGIKFPDVFDSQSQIRRIVCRLSTLNSRDLEFYCLWTKRNLLYYYSQKILWMFQLFFSLFLNLILLYLYRHNQIFYRSIFINYLIRHFISKVTQGKLLQTSHANLLQLSA